MHRQSLIKLICRDSPPVCPQFIHAPIVKHTHAHTRAVHPHFPVFLLAALQSAEMPRSSQNVTPNYFLISLKQLFPVQYNRSLIGDTKQRRLNNKQLTRMS